MDNVIDLEMERWRRTLAQFENMPNVVPFKTTRADEDHDDDPDDAA